MDANQAHVVVVAAVEEKSPAESAGLKPGDVITQVGSSKAERPLDFHRALVDVSAGEQVAVSVRRGEEKLNVALTLGKPAASVTPANRLIWDSLGLDLKPVPTQEFGQQYRTPYRGGLLVGAVRPQSPAAEQGLRRGDVLVGLHVWETVAVEHVNYVLGRPDFESFAPLRFIILRGKDSFYGFLQVAGVLTKRE
jgi:serine protease Do